LVNETLQWAVIAAVGILLLGMLRQVGLLLPASSRAEPSGPPVGRRLPRPVLGRLAAEFPSSSGGEETLLAFVTESCTGCQRLLSSLENGHEAAHSQLVLVARQPSDGFRRALAELPVSRIDDDSGELWKACRVTATPLLVRLGKGGKVIAKEVTHRVDAFAPSGQ
jgi:hypothetical protein